MKAMVFAAGLGTRLRPLTNDRPKALVEVGGKTMLERVITHLADCGVTDITVNIHHFGEKIIEFLEEKRISDLIFTLVMSATCFSIRVEV